MKSHSFVNQKTDSPLKITDDQDGPSNQVNRTKQKRAAIRQKFEPIKVDLFDEMEEDRMTQKRATDSTRKNQSETTTDDRRTNNIESQINLTDMKFSYVPVS